MSKKQKFEKPATPAKPAKAAKVEKTVEEGAVRIRPKVETYVDGVSGNGKRTKNNGDEVAQALNGLALEHVCDLASQLCGEDLTGAYGHLNVGQRRMNLGNKIRGAVAKLNKAEDGSGYTKLAKVAKTFDKLRAKAPAPKAEKEAA